jgi:hypothetical protein
MTMQANWNYLGYWHAVLGTRTAEQVVIEFDLDPTDRVGLDEWLGHAEEDALRVGYTSEAERDEAREQWEQTGYHRRALETLVEMTVDYRARGREEV